MSLYYSIIITITIIIIYIIIIQKKVKWKTLIRKRDVDYRRT